MKTARNVNLEMHLRLFGADADVVDDADAVADADVVVDADAVADADVGVDVDVNERMHLKLHSTKSRILSQASRY